MSVGLVMASIDGLHWKVGGWLLVLEWIERVVGSGWWVFVEYPVGRLIGFSLGGRVPLKAVMWGELGCVMAAGWEIGGVMCILLVAGVCAWLVGCGGIFIVLWVAEAW